MCDACGARASHAWVCPSHDHGIRLCGHHDRTHQARLTREGWERHRLPQARG